jgi:hypothetical protein
MLHVSSRSISPVEAAAIDALLLRASIGESCEASSCDIESLKIVGKCPCGCESLFFTGIDEAAEQFRLADGLGYTEDGEEIGMILWASGSRIVHLELYNYSENPARLPPPASICPFDEARRTKE